MEHDVCVFKVVQTLKSVTLTGVLYFSNIYSKSLYLYSALKSVIIYHLMHILSLNITVILLPNIFFLGSQL